MIAPPNLKDPQERAVYRRELLRVYRGWRWFGLAIVCAGVVWVLVRGEGWDAAGVAMEAVGWAILLTVIVMRSRYHRRRMRGA